MRRQLFVTVATSVAVAACADHSESQPAAKNRSLGTPASVGAVSVTQRSDRALSKQDRLRLEQARLHAAALSPSPKDPGFRPTDDPAPSRAAGVLDNQQSPLSAAQFTGQDEWSGPNTSSTEWLYVYAGKAGEGPTGVPAVIVWTVPLNPNADSASRSTVRIYRCSRLSGYLHIVSARNGRLALTSTATGAPGIPTSDSPIVATFDVGTDTFAR